MEYQGTTEEGATLTTDATAWPALGGWHESRHRLQVRVSSSICYTLPYMADGYPIWQLITEYY